MLIEEVDSLANNEETCTHCKGDGYEPAPTDDQIESCFPDPVACTYCHGRGYVDSFGDY